MILPAVRDPRLILARRGGSLADDDHRRLALWAALCAEHVLGLFEGERPVDERPRRAIEAARAWARGELSVNDAKKWAWESNNAARETGGRQAAARPGLAAAKLAALSAGQAAAVPHVAAHDLGAAAYAIRAVMAAAGETERGPNGLREWEWQLEQVPAELRALVLEDQTNRNAICWNVFPA
jgi:hypothetical protein